MKTVAILGAHRAVAKALVDLIDERELSIEVLSATTTDHLETGLDLIDEKVLAKAELFVACMGGPLIEAVVSRTDRPVLDLAGISRGRRIYPGLEPLELTPGPMRIPVGLAVPLVSALRPLGAFGLMRATITALESAATRDQEGMDELSDQVRSLFNMRDADPKAFPATLAFNVVPTVQDDDEILEEEIREGLARTGLAVDLAAARALVPTFSADSAFVEAVVEDRAPALETVIDAFRAGRGLAYAEELTAVQALGRDDALVGRIKTAPGRVAFFLASDRLRRGSATLACLALERWISK